MEQESPEIDKVRELLSKRCEYINSELAIAMSVMSTDSATEDERREGIQACIRCAESVRELAVLCRRQDVKGYNVKRRGS